MPPRKRQRTLAFRETAAEQASGSANTAILVTDDPALPTPEVSSLNTPNPPSRDTTQDATPTAILTPKAKLRSSWIFDHMPSEDRETRYYNQVLRKEARS